MSGMAQPADAADDLGQIAKGLELLSRGLERQSEQRRREQEELDRQEAAERAAQEFRRQQQAEQQRQAALAKRRALQALAAPPEYAGRVAVHRQALAEAIENPAPDFVVPASPTSMSLSPDGRKLAWTAQGTVQLQDTLSGVIASRSVASAAPESALNFIDDHTLLVTNSQAPSVLIDLEGRVLASFPTSGMFATWPVRSSGAVMIRHEYRQHVGDDWRCQGVAYFDGRGQQVAAQQGLDAENCSSRLDANGRLEVLSYSDGLFTYHVNGNKLGEFRDTGQRRGKARKPYFQWVGSTPYAYTFTGDRDNEAHRIRIWEVAAGRLLCELPGRTGNLPFAGSDGAVYVPQPAARLSVPDCKQVPLGGGTDQLLLNETMVYMHDPHNGQVSVLDASGQIQLRLTTAHRRSAERPSVYVSLEKMSDGRLLVSSDSDAPAQIFDGTTGELRATLVAGRYQNGFLLRSELISGRGWRSRLWPFKDHQQISSFLLGTQQDKYETTADFRARAAALSLPYEMLVTLTDYDADQGQFSAEWQGVPITVPMPPAQARRFASSASMRLTGTLRWLDGEYFELQQAVAFAPDNQRIQLLEAPALAP